MLVLVIVLAVTNAATLAALVWLYLQPIDLPGPDAAVADALDRSPRPPAVVGGTRLMISIEILNPIELAGTKGRLVGIAGSLVPGLTRRIVYDQTLKIVKNQLVEQQVVADVRLHTLRPVGTQPTAPEPAAYSDDVEKVDLDRIGEQPAREDRPPSP